MRDVQAHFADCFRLPHDADRLRITFYFSLTRSGHVYRQPRVTLLGFNGGPESRRLFVADSLKAFNGCLPPPLNEALARTIVGKIYFLQFIVRTGGRKGYFALVCILSRDGRLSLFPIEPPPPPASLRLTLASSAFARDYKAHHYISRMLNRLLGPMLGRPNVGRLIRGLKALERAGTKLVVRALV
jgi:hypothetical protein